MPDLRPPRHIKQFPTTLVRNMLSLATSGFGVVVALAWNQVIQSTVETYIHPYFGKGSGVISLLIYAVIVTTLAVLVTMQLTHLERRLEDYEERAAERRAAQRLAQQSAARKR